MTGKGRPAALAMRTGQVAQGRDRSVQAVHRLFTDHSQIIGLPDVVVRVRIGLCGGGSDARHDDRG